MMICIVYTLCFFFVCLPRQQCHPCGFFSSCNSRDIQSAWCVREDWISPFKRWNLVRNGNVLICSTQRCGLMQIRKRRVWEGGCAFYIPFINFPRIFKAINPLSWKRCEIASNISSHFRLFPLEDCLILHEQLKARQHVTNTILSTGRKKRSWGFVK